MIINDKQGTKQKKLTFTLDTKVVPTGNVQYLISLIKSNLIDSEHTEAYNT